jgi:hypothetical protein
MEASLSNVRRVDFERLSKYPKWFIKSLPWKMVYYEACLEDFDLVHDSKRFASGSLFFCKKCGKPCYTRMDAADLHRAFVVVVIACHLGCGKVWKLPDIEPIWVRVLEDWDEDDYNLWKNQNFLTEGVDLG